MTKPSNVLFHVGDLVLLPPKLLHLSILQLCPGPDIRVIVACRQPAGMTVQANDQLCYLALGTA